MTTRSSRLAALALVAAILAAACSSDDTDAATIDDGVEAAVGPEPDSATPGDDATVEPDAATEELYPEVVGVEATASDAGWTFDVTLSSPYDTPERYADAWRIESVDGETVYGIRELLHDHQFEQPFTRSTSGVEIPDEVTIVVVRGRDQVSGWSPDGVEFELPS